MELTAGRMSGQRIGAAFGGAVLPLGILIVVAMMVLPLPVFLLDTFFVINILLSLLILMVALHTYRPLDFSSFPSLLLIATVLRLALNVASTRIVLSSGHNGGDAAGKVIQAFGDFVIAGNFAVGIFVFAILVIINLVVITKGAGRVSEVTARFTLDAMPGKQMAIDADLNAGLLTPEEATKRRSDVSDEADFYGAMDGASKFVKGDAVAGILILAINIVGGMIIGISQHDLSPLTAAETYVLLSVGDGLVAQIPSLLLSIATAIIVTRVSSTHDMASHIGRQINLSRAWVPVSGVLLLLGLIPGMPNVLFLTAAAGAGAAGWLARNQNNGEATADEAAQTSQGEDSSEPEAIGADDVTDYSPLSIQIGYGLIPLVENEDGGSLVNRITAVRREVSRSLGFVVPGVRIRDDLNLGANTYRIKVGQTIIGEDTIYPDRKLALPGGMSNRKLSGIEAKDPSFGLDAVWILPHQQIEAEADDHVVVEPDSVIATHLSQLLNKYAADLIGPDDVQDLLDNLSKHSPTLVEAVIPKLVPLHALTSILRELLAERVPVADLRRILEGIAKTAARNLSPADTAELLRPDLAPLLLQQIAPINTELSLITLAPELEQLVARTVQQSGSGMLILENALAEKILGELRNIAEAQSAFGVQPVVVVASQIRREFSRFVRTHLPDAVVMAVTEIPENRKIKVVASIGDASEPANS